MVEYVLESDIDVLFDTNTIAFMESTLTGVKRTESYSRVCSQSHGYEITIWDI